MGANALLVRWVGGWHEVADEAPTVRREAVLGLGASQSIAEVERIAADQLAVYREPRRQVSVGLQPSSENETPYLGFTIGDTCVVPDEAADQWAERLVAVTVAMDADGRISYAPEFADVIASNVERWEQALKKFSNGTMRGDSKAATPVANIGRRYVAYTTGGPVET